MILEDEQELHIRNSSIQFNYKNIYFKEILIVVK